MSFFDEEQRKTSFWKVQNTPSPFHYKVETNRQISHGYAPFNSTQKLIRGRKSKQINNDPQNKQSIFQKIVNYQEIESQNAIKKKMMSVFNSRTQRFLNKNESINPGVGSYDLRSNISKTKSKKGVIIYENRINNFNPPSIPTDNFGYKEQKDRSLIKVQIQNNNSGPAPGIYQLRKDLISDKGLKWKIPQNHSRKQPQPNPGPTTYSVHSKSAQMKNTPCFTSKVDRFGKVKTLKKQINPGPGEYNPSEIKKLSKSVSQGYFNSKSKRFQQKITMVPQPGYYNQIRKDFSTQKMKKAVSFNSSLAKKCIFNGNSNPGPGQYPNKVGIHPQLQKSLLRKFNNSQFPTAKRTVFNPKNLQEPGPGQYQLQNLKNVASSAVIHHPVEVVNLKQQNDETPAPSDTTYNNFTISQKIFQVTNKLTLTDRKPFDSGALRFKHYNRTKNTDTEDSDKNDHNTQLNNHEITGMNKKVKKLVMTTVKVKVPFGISSSKYDLKNQTDQQVGPGAYNSQSQWGKKTFNIKSKIQKAN